MINCLCEILLRKGWRLVESLLMWFHVCVVVNCAMLWKWSSPHYLCELVICIILRHWLWQVLCALRKNGYLRGCTISRDVSRAAMGTIFRGMYRAAMVTIIEGRVVRRDRCMDRYVPHGSRTERQRVCITRSDMHHYTWHCIPLHCTYLSLVNLISYFADLLIAFLRNLWLINIELVIADM